MSQVITKRVGLSRSGFLGLTVPGSAIAVGIPPLVSMFNSTGTAYAPTPCPGEQPIEKPLCSLVQRQRHPGALLDSRRNRKDHRMTPCLTPIAHVGTIFTC